VSSAVAPPGTNLLKKCRLPLDLMANGN